MSTLFKKIQQTLHSRKDLFFYISANLFAKLLFGLMGIILTRYLIPSEFGLLKTVIAYTTLISILINLGISDYFYFITAKALNANTWNTTKTMFKFYIYIYFLTYIPASFLFIKIYHTSWLIISVGYLKILTDWMIDISAKLLQVHNKFIQAGYLSLAVGIAISIATLIPIILHTGIIAYLITLVLTFFLISLTFFINWIKPLLYNWKNNKSNSYKTKLTTKTQQVKSVSISTNRYKIKRLIALLTKTFPFLISSIAAYIYTQIDILMLGFYNVTAVAKYASATVLIFSLYIIPTSIYNFFLPKLVKAFQTKNNTKKIYKNIYSFTLTSIILMTPILILLVICPKQILFILYGNKYLDSWLILTILAIAMFFHTFSFISGAVLTASGNQKKRAQLQLFSAIFNIVLNLLLIPKYLALGATLSTLATEILLVTTYTYATILILRNNVKHNH